MVTLFDYSPEANLALAFVTSPALVVVTLAWVRCCCCCWAGLRRLSQ
jgi:hypothetical protein